MHLLLMQHGDALDKEQDPARALSSAGIAAVSGQGLWLAARLLPVGRILHSGKTRARQTAQLLAQKAGLTAVPQCHDGLGPLDLVAPVAAMANKAADNVVLVGHQPFLGKLASVLLCGDEALLHAGFTPGTICWLHRPQGESGWHLHGFLQP